MYKYRVSSDFMSVLLSLNPESIPSQKKSYEYGSDSQQLWVFEMQLVCRCGHVDRQASTPVALHLANSAVRLYSQTAQLTLINVQNGCHQLQCTFLLFQLWKM